ncbi:hypothetical protein Acsp03_15130 [Actinomadura sp. NBRC 104412]|uniref:FtsX-like permease family protein n=1 Tax=Actinomadura sp. NBRC 104412 TaxID=3032203 RepID=UPI0024A47142|nr:FtsX-like permease family protein [Actinomadura sp. NBRC 104412]GLZ04047.1 hypothetical protein Acsp03_15130 [Actinomadura sp. NBRC 104412]
MIGFGLRLTLRGGREGVVRLALTAAAVAIGVALLLVTVAGINGVQEQNARFAWLNSGIAEVTSPHAEPSPHPLLGRVATDHYKDERIIRVDVAATGPRSPVPPGIPRVPGPGQYYASPALQKMLRSEPAAEFGDRYPGSLAGTIGKEALPSPDSLIVVVGHAPRDLTGAHGAGPITSIATLSPGTCWQCRYGMEEDVVALVLAVTSGALLVPVLIFIGTATRLSAARRERRFAAMRLVGATPRQISVIAAVESAVAAAAGTAVGFGLFLFLRVPLAAVPFTGESFYPGDLSLSPAQIALAGLGVPVASAIAAWWALRRVRISPLGVARRVTPSAPRAYRLIPLIAGIAELTYFLGRRPDTTNGQIAAYMSGVLLMMAGLVVTGPWLTMTGARIMARRARRPAALIAGRRLSDDPKAGFRAISGLVLALFVTTTAIGVMTTFVAERGTQRGDRTAASTLVADLEHRTVRGAGGPRSGSASVPFRTLDEVRAVPGVHGAMVLHPDPSGPRDPGDPSSRDMLISCADLAGATGFGRCAPGATTAAVPSHFAWILLDEEHDRRGTVWPASPVAPERLRALPVQAVMVRTDGSPRAIERARTALTRAFPLMTEPATVAESGADTDTARMLTGYQRLVNVVIIVSLCIAGCGLAVGVVGSLNDRKRPFSLLRLTGVPIGVMRRVVLLESAVPLLVTAMAATGAGFLAAELFLRSQLDYTLVAPGLGYYLTVLGGLAGSLAVIGLTLPLMERITGPETARAE